MSKILVEFSDWDLISIICLFKLEIMKLHLTLQNNKITQTKHNIQESRMRLNNEIEIFQYIV